MCDSGWWRYIDWATLVAAFAACVAAYVGWDTHKQARTTLRVSALLQLDERWGSDTMARHRMAAARAMFPGPASYAVAMSAFPLDVDQVLDFLESVGSLVFRDILTLDLAYDFFHYDMDHFCTAAAPYIAAQAKHPRAWEHLRRLGPQLREYGHEEAPTPEELKAFLASEARFS